MDKIQPPSVIPPRVSSWISLEVPAVILVEISSEIHPRLSLEFADGFKLKLGD